MSNTAIRSCIRSINNKLSEVDANEKEGTDTESGSDSESAHEDDEDVCSSPTENDSYTGAITGKYITHPHVPQ